MAKKGFRSVDIEIPTHVELKIFSVRQGKNISDLATIAVREWLDRASTMADAQRQDDRQQSNEAQDLIAS